MNAVVLNGCRPEPLGAYLKALGVLRLVAVQVDGSATGRWNRDVFVLESSLDADELVAFLADRYEPTPVLSPWNSDSGFKDSKSSTATKTVSEVELNNDPRLATYRRAIAVAREVRATYGWDDRPKAEQVALLRNHLPDEALDWLDAAVVLRPERPAFPALLGAGGNFGRLELSPAFMARLLLVLDTSVAAKERTRAWLRAALFDDDGPPLRNDPIGQFDARAAGGVRADAVGGGAAITNPWDLILTIEGSLLWASGVARRLGGATTTASVPFSVAPSAVGHASLSPRERAKAELWAPLWSQPMRLPELRRLFAEGRISWSGSQARTGVDAVRALHTLGSDAGIDGFVRHVVADRMGRSPLAVPVGRYSVEKRHGVAILAELDPWVDAFRQAANARDASSSLRQAAQQIDRALFMAASGRPADLQAVLVAVAAAEAVAGRTERGRTEGLVQPMPRLTADEWLPLLDDGTPEVRLAAAIALGRDRGAVSGGWSTAVRGLVRPVALLPSRRGRPEAADRVVWTRAEAQVPGLGTRRIDAVLADVLVYRSETGSELTRKDAESGGPEASGATPWFPVMHEPLPGDVEAFAAGQIEVDRLGELVSAFLLLDARPGSRRYAWRDAVRLDAAVPAWRVLAPFYSRWQLDGSRRDAGEQGRIRLLPRMGWARRLVVGDIAGVLAEALVRWRQAGLRPIYGRRSAQLLARDGHLHGPRLAAALLCGATASDVRQAAASVCLPPSERETTT